MTTPLPDISTEGMPGIGVRLLGSLSEHHAMMSVRKWLLVLVAAAVAGVVVLYGYGQWQVTRIYGRATYASTNTIPGIVALDDARSHVARLRVLLYRHTINQNAQIGQELEARIASEKTQALASLDQYESHLIDVDDKLMLIDERRMLEGYLRNIPEIVTDSRSGNVDEAQALLQAQAELGKALEESLDQHVRHHIAHGTSSLNAAARILSQVGWQTLLFVMSIVALLLWVGHGIARLVADEVKRCQHLARDNEMFRAMVECVSDRAVVVHDPNDGCRIVYANAAACRHFGADLSVLQTWRPDDFDSCADAKQQHIADELRVNRFARFESEHRVAGGALIPVEVSLNAFNHSGRQLYASMIRDLRPQRRAEAQMLELERSDVERESVRKLSRFAQSAPGFMCTLEKRPDGSFSMVYASPAAKDILGLEADELLADIGNLSAPIVPEDLDAVTRRSQAAFSTVSPIHVTYRIQHPSKGLRWLEANAMPDATEDGTVQWHGFIQDITERKQLDEQLAAQERELRALIDNTPDVIIRYDRDCRRTWISPNYEQVYGSPVSIVLGKKPTEFWGRARMSPEIYESLLRLVMENAEPRDIELDWYDDDGEYVCQSLRVVPEFGDDGEVVSALSLSRDVSEIKHAGMMLADHQVEMVQLFQELSVHEQHQRALLDNFPFFVWLKDADSRLLAVNRAYARAAKVDDSRDMEGKTEFDFFPHDLAQSYVDDDQAVMASGQTRNVVEPYLDEHGEQRWMETWKSPMYVDCRLSGTVGFSRDVTEHVRREQELRTLVENTPDTIARYDRNCRRIFANGRMMEECGATQEQLLGKTPSEFPGWNYATQYEQAIREVIENGKSGSFELSVTHEDGRNLCRHIRLEPELGADGKVISVLAVGRDISEIDAYRKQIHSLAFFDPLTDLPNRSLLNDRIRQTVADASWHGHQFGLMVMDLDRFKEINETLGHGVGDQLLRQAAGRLLECVRIYDTVARLGGDEFGILLPEIRNGADLDTIARKILRAFEHPFVLDGRELFISTSIGVAVYPGDSLDVDALFRYADSAMYHAKKQKGNNFQFYSEDLTASLAGRVHIESALRKAIKLNELELYYQPQTDLESRRVIGAEALLRWNLNGKGMVEPDQFIPIAEETGLIVGIGEWVLLSACQAAVAWNKVRETPLRIAVNLSTRQFIHNDLVSSVRRILEQTGCAAQWLKLEITESLLLEDSKEIAVILETFDSMGLAISIDDFGTGYSALGYLNRFPVSQIKIDRSFVNGIPDEHDKTELVKAMISISQALDLELVAEGVETQEQADCLLSQGCRTVQGYLFGKPMPRDEFERLLVNG